MRCWGIIRNFADMKNLSESTASSFDRTLIDWYRLNGRDLPWRHTHDPYAIWLSEIILQQTRISQGTAYWQRFMERYPTVTDLAMSSEDEVLRLWQGLGYYSRARNLLQAARQIYELGAFPDTVDKIRKLKGVGDYTAAAIASFAFGVKAAAVDGNFYRVLSRRFGISTPVDTTEGKREFAALAQQLMDGADDAADFNQGMMDFGATLCTPLAPHCSVCPMAAQCEALRTGQVELLPVKSKKIKMKTRHLTYYYIRNNGQTAIHRRGSGDIWQGLWEPFLVEDEPLPHFEGEDVLVCSGVKHQLTHQLLVADLHRVDVTGRPSLPEDYIWIDEKDIGQYALPKLVEKLICHVQE